MIYEYKCTECSKITEKDMPIVDEHPREINCQFCKNIAEKIISGGNVVVPDHMRASSSNEIRYDKRPNKRFY